MSAGVLCKLGEIVTFVCFFAVKCEIAIQLECKKCSQCDSTEGKSRQCLKLSLTRGTQSVQVSVRTWFINEYTKWNDKTPSKTLLKRREWSVQMAAGFSSPLLGELEACPICLSLSSAGDISQGRWLTCHSTQTCITLCLLREPLSLHNGLLFPFGDATLFSSNHLLFRFYSRHQTHENSNCWESGLWLGEDRGNNHNSERVQGTILHHKCVASDSGDYCLFEESQMWKYAFRFLSKLSLGTKVATM